MHFIVTPPTFLYNGFSLNFPRISRLKAYFSTSFFEYGLFDDIIFEVSGNITFTEDNASNALKKTFHIFFHI